MWVKIPDEWVDRREFTSLSAADRWHYLAMITLACRGGYYDGVLTVGQALRASDHPDPQAAINRLEELGLVEKSPSEPIIVLVEISVHVAPPSKRTDRTGAERQRRKRAHDKGDHSLCLPLHCPTLAAVTQRDAVTAVTVRPLQLESRDTSRRYETEPDSSEAPGSDGLLPQPVTPLVTRYTGTGRDGTATTTQPSLKLGSRDGVTDVDESTGVVTSWPVKAVPRDEEWSSPDAPGTVLGKGAV